MGEGLEKRGVGGGVRGSHVVNGLDEGIMALAVAYLRAPIGGPILEAIVPEPAFEIFRFDTAVAGGRLVTPGRLLLLAPCRRRPPLSSGGDRGAGQPALRGAYLPIRQPALSRLSHSNRKMCA